MSPETYLRSEHIVGDNLQTSSIPCCGHAAAGHTRAHTIDRYHMSLKQQQQLPVRIVLMFVSCYALLSTVYRYYIGQIHDEEGEIKCQNLYDVIGSLSCFKIDIDIPMYNRAHLFCILDSE